MNKIEKLIFDDLQNMFEDVIDTSLKYIPKEQQSIFILNCVNILLIHKQNIKIIVDTNDV